MTINDIFTPRFNALQQIVRQSIHAHFLKIAQFVMPKIFPTPILKEFESTASTEGRVEKLSAVEFELLSQLMRYPEQIVRRESLKHVSGVDDVLVSDRKLDQWMRALIRKTNALYPAFPLVRFSPPDGYLYTEVPPPKKKAAAT